MAGSTRSVDPLTDSTWHSHPDSKTTCPRQRFPHELARIGPHPSAPGRSQVGSKWVARAHPDRVARILSDRVRYFAVDLAPGVAAYGRRQGDRSPCALLNVARLRTRASRGTKGERAQPRCDA